MCLFQILGQSVVVKFVEENLVEVVHSTWLEKKADENNVSSHFLIICVKINLCLVVVFKVIQNEPRLFWP